MRGWGVLHYFEEVIAVALLAAMMVDMAAQILARYVFNAPLTFTEELARYLYVWLVFIGSSMAIRDRTHVGISFVVDHLRIRGRMAIAIGLNLVVLAFLTLLVWWGTRAVVKLWDQESVTLGVSISVLYAAVPVSGILMIVRTFVRIREDARQWKCGAAARAMMSEAGGAI